jgi:hypothetical protein
VLLQRGRNSEPVFRRLGPGISANSTPLVDAYWGWHVSADYDMKGADKNAVVNRVTFGPTGKRMANLFIPTRSGGAGLGLRMNGLIEP